MRVWLFYPSINMMFSITFSWAKNLKVGAYFSTFHKITLWSSEHEAKVRESLEATTLRTHPSCPL